MKAQGFLHYKNYGLELIFKSFSISHIYFNNVGLKVFNAPIKRIEIEKYTSFNLNLPAKQEVFLLPDFLYDENTLLKKEISESPHYQLMTSLLNKEELSKNSYVQRAKQGTIDMRPATNFKTTFYKELFSKRMMEIEQNQIKPILLMKLHNSYFILDGKHRVALLKLLDKSYPAICLEDFDIKEYYQKYWERIKHQKSNKFKNHLAFYEEL